MEFEFPFLKKKEKTNMSSAPTPVPSQDPTPATTQAPKSSMTMDVIAASQTPSHPQHHFALGQVISTVLLGLVAYQSVETGGALTLANPNLLAQFIKGFESIWVKRS